MFAGHFAVAFAAKRVVPGVSLGTLVFAALFLDLLWSLLMLGGIETFSLAPPGDAFPLLFDHYPWSHSLAMAAVWGVVVARVYWAVNNAGRAALVLFAVVLSHWFLDLVVHLPDLPFRPGAYGRYGLGLWQYPFAALALELGLLGGGFWLYLSTARPAGRAMSAAWALVAFLAALELASTFVRPPGAAAVKWTSLATWLFVAWAWWCDRPQKEAA